MPGMSASLNRLILPGELLERCRDGDEQAQRELFESSLEHVHRILHRLVGPVGDMDDLVQETYLALFHALPAYRQEGAFSSFLFGICYRVAKKRGRWWARFGRLREAAAREPKLPSSGPDQDLEQHEQAAAVERALSNLSFKLRTVLVLFEMEELSGAQIAERLAIPEKTVWSRLHNARKAFRRYYRWPNKEQRAGPTAPG